MKQRVEDRVLSLTPFAAESYESLDLNRLMVFTIGWLRDEMIPPSFDHVVMASYRMFPMKFGLRGYEHPDSNRVNRALLQLGPKYRNWARGSVGTGYALTPLGEETLEDTRRRVLSPPETSGRRVRVDRGYTWDSSGDLAELRASAAFKRFDEGGRDALVNDDVWNALSAFSYTPETAVRSRLITLKEYAVQASDSQAEEFVDALRERFEAMTRSTKRGGSKRA